MALSILLSGFYIRVADMAASIRRALSWVSYTKYTMMGVSSVELHGRTFGTAQCQVSATTSQQLPGGQVGLPWLAWRS